MLVMHCVRAASPRAVRATGRWINRKVEREGRATRLRHVGLLVSY